MIYLPNSFERYLNNLRIYNSFSILKHGLLPRHIENLKKFHLAEGFLFKKHKQPIDLQLLSFNLLCCVNTVKKFDFQVKATQKIMINSHLYTALILTLAKDTSHLKIEFKNGIIINGAGKIKNSLKIITHLDGYSFFDIKTMHYLIYIPCTETNLFPIPTISQWELKFDKFSVFNLFFKE